MATFNGDHEDLQFICGECNYSKIDVNPKNKEHMKQLGKWLMTHSAEGGKYKNIPSQRALRADILEKEKELVELKRQLKVKN